MKSPVRAESEVFGDIRDLCKSPGYIHVLAFLCFRDNAILYDEELTGDDFQRNLSPNRLIRTELSTLLGLLVTAAMDFTMPKADVFQSLVDRTDELLHELHQSLNAPMSAGFKKFALETSASDFLSKGAALLECPA